jgi:hypothetical protein
MVMEMTFAALMTLAKEHYKSHPRFECAYYVSERNEFLGGGGRHAVIEPGIHAETFNAPCKTFLVRDDGTIEER